MDAVIDQVNQAARTADDAGRRKLIDALTDLTYSIESPQDSIQRILYQHLKIAVVRVGCDLDIFQLLTGSKEGLTLDDLASKTGAAPVLLSRILRYLASTRCLKEVEQDKFAANHITKTLTLPGAVGGVYHNFDSHGPAIQALPEFLKEHRYQDITEDTNTPLQKGHNTPLNAYQWISTVPTQIQFMSNWMAHGRVGLATWMDVYPYQDRVKNLKEDQPLFVDVGGAIGAEANAFRDALPDISNQVFLQDKELVLAKAIPHDGVEKMPIDFFQGQPVQGARIYYIKRTIHNYSDQKAAIILRHIMSSMAPDSIILIDDTVVPNVGAHWQVMQRDLSMMTLMAALERTKDQWYALLEGIGLKVNGIWTYTENLRESIIECRLAE